GVQGVDPLLAGAQVVAEDVAEEWPRVRLAQACEVPGLALAALVQALEGAEGRVDLLGHQALPAPARAAEHRAHVVLGEEAAVVPQAREQHQAPSGTRNSAAIGRGGSGSSTLAYRSISSIRCW